MSSSSDSTACVRMRASGAKRLFNELRCSTRMRTGTREAKSLSFGACGSRQWFAAYGQLAAVAKLHWPAPKFQPTEDIPGPCSRSPEPRTPAQLACRHVGRHLVAKRMRSAVVMLLCRASAVGKPALQQKQNHAQCTTHRGALRVVANKLVQQRQPLRVRQHQQREAGQLAVNRNRLRICITTQSSRDFCRIQA